MGCKLSTGGRVDTTVNTFTYSDGNYDALFDAAAELFGNNSQTVRGIIQLKGEILANTKLAAWVEVQLKSAMKTLHGMRVLKCNLHQARAVVLLILKDGVDGGRQTLEKLKELKTIRFLLDEFKSECDQHAQLTVLNDLRRTKHDLDHKLSRIKAWRKAWNIAQWIAKLGVTVLSVAFPVATVWAAATAANNGAGGVIVLIQPLVDSTLNDQQSSCEDEIDLTVKILNEASFIFHRVNGVRVLVEHLVVEMGLLTQYDELSSGEDEDAAVRMAMEKIKRKAGELVDSMEGMKKEVDRGCEDLRRAALTLLQTVIEQVENYQRVQVEIPV